MSRLISLTMMAFLWSVGATLSAVSQDLRALARVDMDASSVADNGSATVLSLALTQAVPYRVQVFDAPNRIAVDFREVAFEPNIGSLDRSERVAEVRAGVIRSGWSRLVMELSEPMLVSTAGMATDPQDGDAVITVNLVPASQSKFSKQSVSSGTGLTSWQHGKAAQAGNGRKMVVIDPGHGGVDPGAQRFDVDEADIMLQFARELREQLLRSGRYDVIMTREDDSFVSLPQRVSLARAAGAEVFISLHADALAEGRATGTTIYTLSNNASDAASADLAERQDRTDILAGVDLTALDDQIATVLMDLARRETTPRSDRLAEALVDGLRNTLGTLHKRPRLEAGFSVLKAPDIPSVLIELGFMSSQTDLKRLQDQDWRRQAVAGIVDALDLWALEDAAITAGRQ